MLFELLLLKEIYMALAATQQASKDNVFSRYGTLMILVDSTGEKETAGTMPAFSSYCVQWTQI